MVGAEPAAACWKLGIFTGLERGRERAKTEDERQEDGEKPPHVPTMLHESRGYQRHSIVKSSQVSSKDRKAEN